LALHHLPSLLPGQQAAVSYGADDPPVQDLNLDQIVAAVAGDREERDFITAILSGRLRDRRAVRGRQRVFQDLDDPLVFGQVSQFAARMSQVRVQLRQLAKVSYRYHQAARSLAAAATYCDAVQSLAGYLATAPVRSPALLAFRDYLTGYVVSDSFTALADDTQGCQNALQQIRYCVRIRGGGRVDVTRYQDEADYSTEVLATFERFKQGAARDYRVRYRTGQGMNHVAAQILELVARLFPDQFAALTEHSRRHAAFTDDGIRRADRDLQFYLAYLEHIRPMRDAGLRFCYPEVSATLKNINADDTFDLALADKLTGQGKPVVTNGFRLGGPERVFVVTGPNQGGKTTFARTFGQLHHLAATGCPVPGSAARLFLPDQIFTHFERQEDLAALSGKLEDDLIRIGAILRAATPDSIVILNEVFASTTVQDARFLGTKLLTAIMRLDALCVYVTFVDELASLGDQVVSLMSTIIPARPAERTYRLVRKPADGLAYALALAEKHGLTYELLGDRIGTSQPRSAGQRGGTA
jgi:DNA mismatch repair protein MutS